MFVYQLGKLYLYDKGEHQPRLSRSREKINMKEYPFTNEELQEFKADINERLNRLKTQVEGLNERRSDFLKSTGTDQVDYESDSKMDQELMKLNGLIENDLNQIQALEAALLRIENKTYGICTETGEYIRKERLKAMPEATTCLKAAT